MEIVPIPADGSVGFRRELFRRESMNCRNNKNDSMTEEEEMMPLSRDFQETVKNRAKVDPEFRNGLLTEAMEAVVRGELDVAKILLRDYINATEGFESLGNAVQKSPKSLMRMLSPDGNPNAQNLFGVTRYLQESAGVTFQVVRVKSQKAKTNVRKRTPLAK